MFLRSAVSLSVAVLVGVGLFVGLNPTKASKPGKEGKPPEAAGPYQAREWRKLAWRDERGRIPENAIQKARQEYEELAQRSSTLASNANLWQEVGPSNVSGRARSLLIHPTEPNRMWMGAVSGGIWYTSTFGANWRPVSDQLPSLAIGSMAMDPKDPMVMYAGTGEGFFNGDAIFGQGILRTLDGGETWNLMPSTTGFGSTNRIAISPDDSKVMLAALSEGGIVRTEDAGETWTSTLPGGGLQVIFDPSDGQKAVAVVRDDVFGSSRGYYTRDGGKTWVRTALFGQGFFARIELAYAPSNTSVLYAVAGPSGLVYKSVDGGVNYFRTNAPQLGGNQWWYDNAVWVDPTNANRVVVGGINVFRSEDAGASFTQISSGYILTDQVHPDVHLIKSAPGYGVSNRRVYVLSDGGAFVTDDIRTASTSAGWKTLSNNARTTQFYGAAGEAITGRIVGGTQDNGTLVLNRGSSRAGMTSGGDGGFSAIDPLDPNYLYGEYVGLQIHRSTNGGLSSEYIWDGIDDVEDGFANFIAPLVLDTAEPSNLYGGGASLWRSMNAKAETPTWTEIKDPLSTNPVPPEFISAIAIARNHSNHVWVGHNNGQIFRSLNATWDGPTWTEMDVNNEIPNRFISRILVDPENESTIYVALGGFSPDNLWVTRDSGNTWTALTGGGTLPAVPIRGIALDPRFPGTIMIGTEVGPLISKDDGATWQVPVGAPRVSVDEVNRYHNSNKLLVTTHGRGIWLYGITQPVHLTTPGSMLGGSSGTCTVYLDGNAPASGLTVALTASNSLITVPATVTVPEGASQASFTVTTEEVSTASYAFVTATLNGGKARGQILIQRSPGTLSMSIKPGAVYGGTATAPILTVSTTNAAPVAGWTVAIESLDPTIATSATSVKIPLNKTSVSVPIWTKRVSATSVARFRGTLFNKVADASLTVYPPPVLSVSPAKVIGGSTQSVLGTVTLPAPAPAGGTTLSVVSSDTTLARTPATVKVFAGETAKSFIIAHSSVAKKSPVTITASIEPTVKSSAVLTLMPPLPALTLQPTIVVGGSAQAVVGTVKILEKAPVGGLPVTLVSANTTVATVPASVTIPEGSRSTTFDVNHSVVAVRTNVGIAASTPSGISKAVLTVTPHPVPVGLTLTPKQVRGGSNTTIEGKVSLSFAAPAGGTSVTLESLDTTLLTVPATVTVPAGLTSATFNVGHSSVMTTTTAYVRATVGSVSKTASVTLLPPLLTGLSLTPSTLKGGATSIGKVTIGSPAPLGGVRVNITVTPRDVFNPDPPYSAFIEPGNTEASFFLETIAVAETKTVSVVAEFNGVTKTRTLTINP